MIGEICKIDYHIIDDQLPLFYDLSIEGSLALVVSSPGEYIIGCVCAYVFSTGRLHNIHCGHLESA
jgi:hypothetical protein